MILNSIFLFICLCLFNINATKGAENNNSISIAMATDNNYAYPTMVAITSILNNCNPKTNINFYVMLSGDFEQSLKDKIKSFEKKYKNCSVSFIDMKDKLKDLYTSGNIKTAAYYRLLLPDILSELDKILYMDVDTITQYDLSDLFNIDIEDYYLAGCKDNGAEWISIACVDYVKKFGKEDCLKNYINSGILLFNLKKMREDNLVEKLIECASSHNFNCHDQDTINWICHDKIKKIDNIYNNFPNFIQKNDVKNQVIIHYAADKPWKNKNVKYASIWWDYAKKTGLLKEIKEKFIDQSKNIKEQSKKPIIKKPKNKARVLLKTI